MKSIILSVLILLLLSCSVEQVGKTTTRIQNRSGYKISMLPFKSGSIVYSDTFTIANESEKAIVTTGRGGASSYAFQLNSLADSIVVVFDGMYKVSHYALQVEGTNPKAYPITHNRNVLNDKNYQFNKIKVTKRVNESEYVYTFALQDYLDAK